MPGNARGQVEPFAALAAVFALCLGLSTYAIVLSDTQQTTDRDVAGPTLVSVHDALSVRGIVHPSNLSRARLHAPTNGHLNATLSINTRRWSVGPLPPPTADRAARHVSVRLGPGRIRAGRLSVVVW